MKKVTIQEIFFDIALDILILIVILGFTIFNSVSIVLNGILLTFQILLCLAFIIDMPFLGKKIELYLINKGVFKDNNDKGNNVI